jgi:Family of unknown function (DUF6308)
VGGGHEVEIQLPNRVIDHADERAAFFFVSNISSVGSSAYDRRVASPENPPDRIEEADIRAVNQTMMVRTQYVPWTQFTGSAAPLPWLQQLELDWNLFTLDDDAWAANGCEGDILNALAGVMAPYRTTSITTKVLHIKRPHLIPICDSYVVGMVGGRSGDAKTTTELIGRVREIGRQNLPALEEIERRLTTIGIERSLVRILDSLLWSGYQDESTEAEFGRWLVKWHNGRLFF